MLVLELAEFLQVQALPGGPATELPLRLELLLLELPTIIDKVPLLLAIAAEFSFLATGVTTVIVILPIEIVAIGVSIASSTSFLVGLSRSPTLAFTLVWAIV